MKKIISLILTVALSVVCFAAFAGCNKEDNVIKIGVFEPASGDNGAGGKQEVLGVQYANKKYPTVTVDGKEYKVELVSVDNESSNDKAPTAAQSLVTSGVSMILGSYGSGVSIAAAPTFEEAGIPALGITCTNPQVTADCDVYYRICFLDPFQGTVLANYAKSLSKKKAYCLSKLGDDYSAGLVNYFKQAFGDANCVCETFPNGTTDFSAYVANAKTSNCDVFFSPVSTEAAALIINQANAQSLGMPILAGDTWDSNVITGAAQGTSLEIVVTTFYQEGGNTEFDNGIKAWINSDSTAKTNNGGNDEISAVTAMGYDAYIVALEAIKKAKSKDPSKILEVMDDLQVSGLVCGDVSFDENGDAKKNEAVVKKVNTTTGKFEFVKKQTVTK